MFAIFLFLFILWRIDFFIYRPVCLYILLSIIGQVCGGNAYSSLIAFECINGRRGCFRVTNASKLSSLARLVVVMEAKATRCNE